MWGHLHFSDFTVLLGKWMMRWLQVLGENPPPARDHGLCAWQYLRQCSPRTPAQRTAPTSPASIGCAFIDEPYFSLGQGHRGW